MHIHTCQVSRWGLRRDYILVMKQTPSEKVTCGVHEIILQDGWRSNEGVLHLYVCKCTGSRGNGLWFEVEEDDVSACGCVCVWDRPGCLLVHVYNLHSDK